jgi:hypothetical protein
MMGSGTEVDFTEMESFIASVISQKQQQLCLHQEVKGDYLESTLTLAGFDGADRPWARIRASGVELFFLVVDQGFGYTEFESDDDEQKDALRLMVELAVRYLQGRYARNVRRSIFGRQKEELTIEFGQLYYFDKLPKRMLR